jgi:hypothetical protein
MYIKKTVLERKVNKKKMEEEGKSRERLKEKKKASRGKT